MPICLVGSLKWDGWDYVRYIWVIFQLRQVDVHRAASSLGSFCAWAGVVHAVTNRLQSFTGRACPAPCRLLKRRQRTVMFEEATETTLARRLGEDALKRSAYNCITINLSYAYGIKHTISQFKSKRWHLNVTFYTT